MKNHSIRVISVIGLWLLLWSLADVGRPYSNAQSAETPRALATGDFDEDGTPDLLSGYASGGGGLLKFQRGNVAAVYSHSREAQQQTVKTAEPFFEPATIAQLSIAPDFLGAGDFDADGHWDIVAAQRGESQLVWLPGDGGGGFGEPQIIALPGAVTALRVGEVNRPDGLADVAVAVLAQDGARLLIFEGADGALKREPESLSLPAAARDLALGELDNAGMLDVAAAAGDRLVLVRGRDRKLSLDHEQQATVLPAQVEERLFSTEIQALAAGHFTGRQREELALLLADGTLAAIAPEEPAALSQWPSIELYRGTDALRPGVGTPPRLFSARVAASPADQLLLLTPGSPSLLIVNQVGQPAALALPQAQAANEAATLNLMSAALDLLPLRLNADALSDLAILTDGARGITFAMSAPQATLTVTNTNDSGLGSLRQAILDANANAGPDTIQFNLTTGGRTITPITPLPPLTDTVTLDATTQPGFAGAPLIELNGERADGSCLVLESVNNVVRGLVINRCKRYAIDGGQQGGNRIEGCYIGTDLTGTQARGNFTEITSPASAPSVYLHGILADTLGGTTVAARNVISGNTRGGVVDSRGSIQGNFIGTDVTGKKALGNFGIGVVSTAGVIGGTVAGAGNVISGNLIGANLSSGSTTGGLVQGNIIGLDITGTAPLPNDSVGLAADGPNITIGGTTPTARNIISANKERGLTTGSGNPAGNRVQGNYIGTDISGTKALGNQFSGIFVSSTSGQTTIGGTASGARNVISGNAGTGIDLRFGGSTVQGNFIGTDATGTKPLGNGSGIDVSASDCVIGGTEPNARNVIAASKLDGISAINFRHRIQNNLIGVLSDGTAAGNGGHGVLLRGTKDVLIGGEAENASNVIANNGGSGIALEQIFSNDPGEGNTFRRNSIYNNGLLGIDLANDGGTPNDAGDADTGVNDLQNYPALISIAADATNTVVRGALQSLPNAAYTLEFFANTQCNPAGLGEGRSYMGSAAVNTDANGNASVNATLPIAVTSSQFVTATATDAKGNTSEFSPCTPLNFAGLRLSLTAQPYRIGLGANVTYTITVTNTLAATATDVVVNDTLSAALTITECTATAGGACTGTGTQRTIRFASLPANSSATITIKATVGCEILNFSTVPNTAVIMSTLGGVPGTGSTATFTASVTPSTTFSQNSYSFTSAGGLALIRVMAPIACSWAAVSQASFITIVSGGSGQGVRDLLINVTENTAPAPRSGSILVAGATLPIMQAGRATTVSAASYAGDTVAAESIVALFGSGYGTQTISATELPLPTQLGGLRVDVFERNSPFTTRPAPLFFVSPGQINFQIPAGTASGRAEILVWRNAEILGSGFIQIAAVAPGLFSANASGQGVAAAVALRVKATGEQIYEPVADLDPALNQFVARPLDLGSASDQLFLVLFGTGLRARSAPQAVTAQIGKVDAEVLFAGAQGGFVGLDQVNLRIPRSLGGRGLVTMELIVDGKQSNAVQINIK